VKRKAIVERDRENLSDCICTQFHCSSEIKEENEAFFSSATIALAT